MCGHWEPVMEWVEDVDEDREEWNSLTPEEQEFELLEAREAEEERDQERYAMCRCGAYKYSDKAGRYIHVADCCCGNT